MADTTIPFDLEDDVLLNQKQLRQIIPYSSVHIARLVKAGKFPPPIVIGHQKFWRKGTVRKAVREAEEAANSAVTSLPRASGF